MKFNGISVTNIKKMGGRSMSFQDRVNGKRMDNSDSVANQFNVTSYGAVGNGIADDTAAIQSAIDAASANGGGTVYFPTGTYKVMIPGDAVTTLYQKSAGTWGTPIASGVRTEQEVVGSGNSVWFVNGPPTTEGADGDIALDYRAGFVYLKAAGTWSLDSTEHKLLKKAGTGWSADYWSVNDANGIDGDYYFKHYLDYDGLYVGCVFRLEESTYDNITFLGDGATSIISQKCWGDIDPMDYTLNFPDVDYTQTYLPRLDDGGDFYRGSIFYFDRDLTSGGHNGIVFDGLNFQGNTTANGRHDYQGDYWRLRGWDITHKAIYLGVGGSTGDCTIRNCTFDGFRGETIYRGGLGTFYVNVHNCTISGTNASAISCSGHVTVTSTSTSDSYNAFECYALDGDVPQFLIVRDCTIDMSPVVAAGNFEGEFGVVYIGDSTCYCVVDNVSFTQGVAGIFLSEFADNVDIDNCTFTDQQTAGIYCLWLNQYAKTGHYENISIDGCTWVNSTRSTTAGIYPLLTESPPASNWTISNATLTSSGSTISAFIRNEIDNAATCDITISDSILTAVTNGNTSSGSGVVPTFVNCTVGQKIINTFSASPPIANGSNPRYKVTHLNANDQQLFEFSGNVNNFPNGYQIEVAYLPNTDQSRNGTLGAQSWNSFTQTYTIHQYDAITMQFNSTTNTFDFVSLDELKYAP